MTIILAAACLATGATPAFADPSASDWAALRACESSGNYSINTGNGYFGAYQFDQATWEWMGGTGLPSDASPAEQDYRALRLYRINGWGPWPACSKKLGLKNDADAKSGVLPADPGFATTSASEPATSSAPETTHKKKKKKAPAPATPPATATATTPPPPPPAGDDTTTTATKPPTPSSSTSTSPRAPRPSTAAKKTANKPHRSAAAPTSERTQPTQEPEQTSTSSAPTWPGTQFFPGEYSEDLKTWQRRAALVGYDVIPTGYFGPKTERAALDLQEKNGITAVGYIGPQTWSAAWETPETTG